LILLINNPQERETVKASAASPKAKKAVDKKFINYNLATLNIVKLLPIIIL
jgi:hypothetical protein